jgi:hypothetical protein
MPARRIIQHVCAFAALGSVAMLSALGCVDTEATFYVRTVAQFTDDCICEPGASVFLSSGTMEASLGFSYDVCLQVENALVSTEDADKPRAETNFVEIYAVDVTLEASGLSGSPDCPTAFTYPSKGLAEPESTGVVIALALPSCMTQAIAATLAPGTTTTVIANFVVHGHTTGGDELETPEYSFPITVGRNAYCYGEALEEGDEVPCRPGQDKPAPSNFCPE